ncbi:RNA helicase [Nitzschia inconspicua]|uniref:RNA helicase n=1 Tax=Nitzschia inconspicua TaxID=303405 RepID=A0A9K3L829_9STRA|nr:RNA helicase [Nitzschia inconspicua]
MIHEPIAVDGLRGHWLHGKPGVEKTRSATGKYPNCYKKAQNKWWDGYAGESIVCMEDVDNLNDGICHLLKNWTDRYPVTGESKGGTVPLQHTAFVCTSNFTIEELVNAQVSEGKREQMLEALER